MIAMALSENGRLSHHFHSVATKACAHSADTPFEQSELQSKHLAHCPQRAGVDVLAGLDTCDRWPRNTSMFGELNLRPSAGRARCTDPSGDLRHLR